MAKLERAGRSPAAEAIAKAVMRGFSPATADEAQEALRQVFGPTIETMLKAGPGARLGCPSNDKSPKPTANRRNGHAPKTVRASAGEPEAAAPRDRGGPFEPVAAPKGPSGPSDMEGRVMSVYARGMSQRGIAPTVRETRGFPMSAETVSAMTDRVWEELERRRSRPLEPACAFLFVDRLYVPAGKGRGARNAAACVAPGCDLQGRKDVPGLWTDESEGARRRVQTFDGLRRRGLEDAVCACAGGVAGLEDGPRSVLPLAGSRRRAVHMVRNSLKCVPQKGARAFCRDLGAACGAPSAQAARPAWEAFREAWSRRPGAVAAWERSEAHLRSPFGCGSAVRKVMHATNAVESVNAGSRKAVGRGRFPGEGAAMRLPCLGVKEPCRPWGEGRRQSGWSQARNQLPCDEGVRPRIERCL